jgi:di/tricarboxylate transporter
VTSDLAIVLALLAAAVVMFVLNRPRMDAVALIMIAALPLTGVITVEEALAGFSDPNIVLIAALFVIGEGLVRTGVARGLGDWINAKAGNSESRLLILLMVAAGGLGALMSSTAVVAIFIPVVLRICQNTGVAPSRLMMPLSFAALISGMLTLVATAPNLVVNSELARQGFEGFHFFSVTVFGLPVLVLGVLYMLIARRWLAADRETEASGRRRPSLREWSEQYRLADWERRVRVRPGSLLAGRTLEDLSLRAAGLNLLAIERGAGRRKIIIRPEGATRLRAPRISSSMRSRPGTGSTRCRSARPPATLPSAPRISAWSR